jgi:hypothetical protein
MADEANKPLKDADEISDDGLQQVVGGSTPLNVPEIKIGTLPEPTPTGSDSAQKGTATTSWDIAKNTTA